MSTPLAQLSRALHERAVRFVLIGVGGANFHALDGATVFTTEDRDLFLPLDADNAPSPAPPRQTSCSISPS